MRLKYLFPHHCAHRLPITTHFHCVAAVGSLAYIDDSWLLALLFINHRPKLPRVTSMTHKVNLVLEFDVLPKIASGFAWC